MNQRMSYRCIRSVKGVALVSRYKAGRWFPSSNAGLSVSHRPAFLNLPITRGDSWRSLLLWTAAVVASSSNGRHNRKF